MTKTASVVLLAALVAGCSSSSSGSSASASSSAASSATSSTVATEGSGSTGASAAASLAGSATTGGVPEAGSTSGANLTIGSDPLFADDAAIVEASEDGSTAFVVDDQGRVTAALADPQGKPTTERSLKLSFAEEGSDAPKEVLLIPDANKQYFVGRGPALEADITPVHYEITGGTRPVRGILHLPKGGTKILALSAQVQALAHVQPVVGPHGGRIERVGDDDVELLVDPDSGEARAWIIVDGKVVPPARRELGLYLDGRYVDCYPDQNDSFYVKLDARFEVKSLHKVSVSLYHEERIHTVVWGYRPHLAVYIHRPAVDVRVVGWTSKEKVKYDKNPNEPGLGWAKGKEKHKGTAGVGVSVGIGGIGGKHGHGGGKGKGGKGKH